MYVVLLPNSNTNPSKYHRVVDVKDWVKASMLPCKYVSEHKTLKEAEARKNELNGK